MENTAYINYIKQLEKISTVVSKKTGNKNTYSGARNKDGIPHGQGKMKLSNGGIYEGEWQNGKITGQGKITFKNDEFYEGEFENGKLITGKMKRTIEDGLFEGDVKGGKRHGKGKLTDNNGSTVIGIWKNGTLAEVDSGVISLDIKDQYGSGIYKGEVKNNKPHGKGIVNYSNDCTYSGEWKDGIKEGYGEFNFPVYSGDSYDAKEEFHKKYNDLNRLFWLNKYEKVIHYKGDWANGKPNGKGFILFENDYCYNGEISDGLPNGNGIHYHKEDYKNNGYYSYKGEWVNGLRHGQGHWYKEETDMRGVWENDRAVEITGKYYDFSGEMRQDSNGFYYVRGKALMRDSNGYYEGEFTNDDDSNSGVWPPSLKNGYSYNEGYFIGYYENGEKTEGKLWVHERYKDIEWLEGRFSRSSDSWVYILDGKGRAKLKNGKLVDATGDDEGNIQWYN